MNTSGNFRKMTFEKKYAECIRQTECASGGLYQQEQELKWFGQDEFDDAGIQAYKVWAGAKAALKNSILTLNGFSFKYNEKLKFDTNQWKLLWTYQRRNTPFFQSCNFLTSPLLKIILKING